MYTQASDETQTSNDPTPFVFVDMSRTSMPDAEVAVELLLCKALGAWDPWAEPSVDVVTSLHKVGDIRRNRDWTALCVAVVGG